MSTDSTELTFIRCPSCRSLVPALSTRCRMCGTTLEQGVAGDKKTEDLKLETVEKETMQSEEVDPLNDFLEDDQDYGGDRFDKDAAVKELDDLLDELSAQEEAENGHNREEPVQVKSEIKETPSKAPAKAERKEVKKEVKEEKIMETKSEKSSVSFKQVRTQAALFGWLVSYDKSEGNSLELREGKFFVTRNSLKKTDLILADDSVSTPHAMITVNQELGFQLQDLMSEQGVFVKRRDAEDYDLIEDIEVIENGDWVRFGKVEYLVVFLPE